MTVELDFRTAGYLLWSFWLKEEHRSDCQLTGETLLTILGLLTGPRIENLVTCEALSVLSSSLNRLRSSEIINFCLERKELTINGSLFLLRAKENRLSM